MSVDRAIYWTGAAVLLAGGWAAIAALAILAIERTLKLLGLTKLILNWYAADLRARLKKRRAAA